MYSMMSLQRQNNTFDASKKYDSSHMLQIHCITLQLGKNGASSCVYNFNNINYTNLRSLIPNFQFFWCSPRSLFGMANYVGIYMYIFSITASHCGFSGWFKDGNFRLKKKTKACCKLEPKLKNEDVKNKKFLHAELWRK